MNNTSGTTSNSAAALFGADTRAGVVAVEPGPESTRIYRRWGGALAAEDLTWSPWFVSSQRLDVPAAEEERLEGAGFCWMYRFRSLPDQKQALERARHAGTEVLAMRTWERQFLVASGITLFKNLAFTDLRRMQVDIETTTLATARDDALILMAAVCDSTGFREAVCGDERSILERLNEIIQNQDPDVIEGHNIYGFDIPYIIARAESLGVPLEWGRDGSAPRIAPLRVRVPGALGRSVLPAYVYGRSVVDTLIGVQRYDVSRSELTSHALKEVAKQLGLAAPDRVYLNRARMDELWKTDCEQVKTYCLQDVDETEKLGALVMPPSFYVSQMVPDSFQGNSISGMGEKIDLLLVREYLRQGRAVPPPRETRPIVGAFTDIKFSGVVGPVVKCDVESLYPSLMLSRGIAPRTDSLGVFLPLLAELTRRRFEAKAKKGATEGSEQQYWDGLQGSYKILINSFFGYLGAANFHFNDPDAAERVTLGGQTIVRQVVEALEQLGASVIEVDTDGVYFKPPAHVTSREQEEQLIDSISVKLPEGVRLAHDGRWKLMVSLKVKNYALLGYGGQRIYRGAALRSRADERFGQDFISAALDCIFEDRVEDICELYMSAVRRIDAGALEARDICRRERITAAVLQGKSLARAAACLDGLTVGDFVKLYRCRDGSLKRMEDYSGDEDREFLKLKLYRFAERLRPALGDRFSSLCPAPGKNLNEKLAGQLTFDLF